MAEVLAKLQAIIEHDMPKANAVKDALHDLAAAAKAGPAARQQLIDLCAVAAVTKSWSLICYGGDPSVILLKPGANEVREASLQALYSLTAGFPEIMDPIAWMMIQQAIDTRVAENTQTWAMKVLRNICIKSEGNREHITWELDLMDHLIALIKRTKPSAEFVREWCGAMKTMILTDDIRVAYNRAPERKRIIHQKQALPVLARLLFAFEGDEGTQNAIVVFLGSMSVNEDMCIAIETGNIFPTINKIFKNFPQNQMLIKNTISFLRYLNVSQTVRDKCGAYGLVKWILQLMLQHKNSEDMLEVGLSCLAFMTLRNACHTAQLVVAGGIPIIFELITIYPHNTQIHKGLCLTLRNVAANGGKSARSKILDNSGEAILTQIQEKFPDIEENYVKPALRDLLVVEDPVQQPLPSDAEQFAGPKNLYI